MKRFGSVEEILDFAIANEIKAHDFYMKLADKMENAAMRQVFEEFAIEEIGHKIKLEAVKAGDIAIVDEKVQGLGIADYVVAGEAGGDISYANALVLAMKQEKAAYRLYMDLAAIAEAEELTDMFLALANEEAKHKLRFELEYDDNVMKEN